MQNARRDCPGRPVETGFAWSAGARHQAFARWPSCGQAALGRELLAAVAAALVDDRTAVLGGHAGTETVTAGTHELGGLVCTLHVIKPRRARFLLFGSAQSKNSDTHQ